MGVPANRGLGVVLAGDDGMSNRRGLGRTVWPWLSAATELGDKLPSVTQKVACLSLTQPTDSTVIKFDNPGEARL